MTKTNADSVGSRTSELMDQDYPELMNVARSARENHDADISTDAPKKPELVERMAAEGIHLDDGTWMLGDDEIERLPSNPTPDRNGPSEPQPEVVLYAQTRASATKERLDEIEDALDEIGYELRNNGRDDTLSVIIPVDDGGIDLDETTYDELYEQAKELDVEGRSDMDKEELLNALESQ